MKIKMENSKKIYKSYEEIDRELAVLKTERELHYQNVLQNVENVKTGLKPVNLAKGLLSNTVVSAYQTFSPMLISAFPLILNKIIKAVKAKKQKKKAKL